MLESKDDTMVPDMSTSVIKQLKRLAGGLMVLLPVAYAGNMHQLLNISVYDVQLLALVLTLALSAGFLIMAEHSQKRLLKITDFVCAALTFCVGLYVSLYYPMISMEAPYLPGWLIATSVVLFSALIFNLPSSAGIGILSVVLIFLAYGLFGHLVPGELQSRETTLSELVVYLAIDANGMLGTALKVAVLIVIPFLLFGQLLARCGAADFFNDIALAGMGRFRGGPAKVAVTASGLFGSISGSAVGNVVGTGVVTIPMMKRAGFTPSYAASVEAVASTGGQLVPPVMGAAAFIMADFIGVDYSTVMMAALPSALLYYLAIFINVDLYAAKRNIRSVEASQIPSGWHSLKQGWHFLIPFLILFYALFALNMRPERAAVLAVLTLLIVSLIFGYRGRRIALSDIWPVVSSAGGAACGLVIVCAAAGLIIGVLNISGLAFNLTLHIINASGENVFLLALITALISIVLGMGMPTVGVYILLATLVAPALVEVGIPVISAHLFVFYFGLLSMVTPPVALASFAAANIVGAGAWSTSIAAMRLAWPAYVVPFLFLFAPSLILEGSLIEVVLALGTAILGIYMVTAGIVGYMHGIVSTWYRCLLLFGGLFLLIPADLFSGGFYTDIIGLTVLGFCIAYKYFSKNRSALPLV